MQQFSLGPARDARVNGQHEKAALLQASREPLFDRGGIGHFGVAVGRPALNSVAWRENTVVVPAVCALPKVARRYAPAPSAAEGSQVSGAPASSSRRSSSGRPGRAAASG